MVARGAISKVVVIHTFIVFFPRLKLEDSTLKLAWKQNVLHYSVCFIRALNFERSLTKRIVQSTEIVVQGETKYSEVKTKQMKSTPRKTT